MKDLTVDDLRALIRLIGPARALREDTEKSLMLETYSGTGRLTMRTFRSLRDQVAQITQDSSVAELDIDVHEESKDKHLVSQVMIASGQLLAYLEAQTGMSGIASAGKSHYQVQTAPNIELNMGDVVGGQVDRVMDMINDAMRHIPRRPPQVPRPPMPPEPPGQHGGMPGMPGMPGGRPPKGKRGREFFWESDEDDDDEA